MWTVLSNVSLESGKVTQRYYNEKLVLSDAELMQYLLAIQKLWSNKMSSYKALKASLRLIEGEDAKVVSDSLNGLDLNAVVTVLTIDGDDVEVEDSAGEQHSVKKSDLKQNKGISHS